MADDIIEPNSPSVCAKRFEVEIMNTGKVVAAFDTLEEALDYRPAQSRIQHIVRQDGIVVFPARLVGKVPARKDNSH